MRLAYFDCFSGISGDMTIGAFLDAGLDMDILKKELAKLGIKGYTLKKSKVKRGAIAGTKFDCITPEGRHHTHRSVKEILDIIAKSGITARAKALARETFLNIGRAEAKVHGTGKFLELELHELGEIDSIVDIVGTAIAVDKLGIDEVYASDITMGRTMVDTRHGAIPIPGPAALELLKGAPSRISSVEAELVTPTGAGIVKTLARGFGRMPRMKVRSIGYGAGSRELDGLPNMLRVIIGDTASSFKEDTVMVIETNIDDMNPQGFEYLFERLFKEGVLDAYTTTIQMKKTRPAFKLTVLAAPESLEKISSVIFSETTSIGVRFYEAGRYKLDRKFVTARTKYGNVKVKVSGIAGNSFTVSPEYDECVRLARGKKVPFKTIYEEAKNAIKI